jgi:hypothetical protein
LQSQRDSAWLEATLRGHDPETWITNLPKPMDQMADGFIGERALWSGSLALDAIHQRGWGSWWGSPGDFSSMYAFSGSSSWWTHAQSWTQGKLLWFTTPGDAEFLLRYNLLTEDCCRSGIDHSGPLLARLNEPGFGFIHPIGQLMVTSPSMFAESGAKAEISARMHRIAGCIIRQWYLTRILPDPGQWNHPHAQQLLAAFPLTPALQYHRISATRFRITIDPLAPATTLVPTPVPTTPAKIKGQWNIGKHWLELELNQSAAP